MVKSKSRKSLMPSEIAQKYFSETMSSESEPLIISSCVSQYKDRSRSRSRSTPSRSSDNGNKINDPAFPSSWPPSAISDWVQWADISVKGRSRSSSGSRSRKGGHGKGKSLLCPSGHRYCSCTSHKLPPDCTPKDVTVKHVQSQDPCCSRVLEAGRRLRQAEGWNLPTTPTSSKSRSRSSSKADSCSSKASSSQSIKKPEPAAPKTMNFFIRKPDAGNKTIMQSTLAQKVREIFERNVCGRPPQHMPSTEACGQDKKEDLVVYNNDDFQIVLRRKPGVKCNRLWNVKATCKKISPSSSERSKRRKKKTEGEVSSKESFHQMPGTGGPYPDYTQMPPDHHHHDQSGYPQYKMAGTNTSFSQDPNMAVQTEGYDQNTQNMDGIANANDPNSSVNPNMNQGSAHNHYPDQQAMGAGNNTECQGQGQGGFPIKIGNFEKIVAPEDKFKVKMFFYTGEPGEPGYQRSDDPKNAGNSCKTCNPGKSGECPYSDSCWKKTKDSCDFEKYLEEEARKSQEKEEAKKREKEEKKKKKGEKKGEKKKKDKKGKKGKEEETPPPEETPPAPPPEETPPPPPPEGEQVKAKYQIKNNYDETVVTHAKQPQQSYLDKDVVFKSIRELAPETLGKDIVIKSRQPIKRMALKQWNNSRSPNRTTRSPVKEKPVCERKNSIKAIKTNPTSSIKQSYSVNYLTHVSRTSLKTQSFHRPKISNIIKAFENKIQRKNVKPATVPKKTAIIRSSPGDSEKSNSKRIKKEPLVKIRKKQKKEERNEDMFNKSRELACITLTSDKEETVETFNDINQNNKRNNLGTTQLVHEKPVERDHIEDYKIPIEIREIIDDSHKEKKNTKHNEKPKPTAVKRTTKRQPKVLPIDNQRVEKEQENIQRKDVANISLQSYLGLRNIEPDEIEYIEQIIALIDKAHTPNTCPQYKESLDDIIITDIEANEDENIASTSSQKNRANSSNQIVPKQTRRIEKEKPKVLDNKIETISPILLRDAYKFKVGKNLPEDQILDRRKGTTYDINYNQTNMILPPPKHYNKTPKVNTILMWNTMKGTTNGKNNEVKISEKTEGNIKDETKNIVSKLRSKFEDSKKTR